MYAPILQPFEDTDRLARLFNTYLFRLRSLEAVTAPRECMRQWVKNTEAEGLEDQQRVAEIGLRLYSLQVLNNSLHSLYGCVQWAATELDSFIIEGGDFDFYAAQRRVEDAKDNGFTEPEDVTPDGKDFRLRTEPEALAPFQLHVVLAAYFPSSAELAAVEGERIGSSDPAAFAYWHNLILNDIVFALDTPGGGAGGENLLATQRAAAADEEDDEEAWPEAESVIYMEPTLTGSALVEEINAVLTLGQEAAALYASLGERDAAGYERLFNLVNRMLFEEDSD